ncbi:hypothetical protein [Streptomyces sp. NPDC007083]|uniref:hypothetical protein n=1 Tax=Streptomyces sp. NPDC007083 TaxID=3156913 RepID=UPI0033FB71E8
MVAPVVIPPLVEDGGRRVRLCVSILGRAHDGRDVFAPLEQAGWDTNSVALEGPLIDWCGGGSDVWQPSGGDR